jgi:hypothetical protein
MADEQRHEFTLTLQKCKAIWGMWRFISERKLASNGQILISLRMLYWAEKG